MMMSAKQEPKYVQSGLVFWLDGLNKGSSDGSEWIDRIGGVVFENVGATPSRNGYSFSSGQYLMAEDLVRYPASTSTIEVCIHGTGNNGAVFQPRNRETSSGSPAILFYYSTTSNVTYITDTSSRHTYAGVLKTGSISCSNTRMYRNGVLLTLGGNNYLGNHNSSYTSVGRRLLSSGSAYFVGEIFAIRIYNRVLSADDILQNYAADQYYYPEAFI